jgi:hypothetical protein
MDLSNGYPAFRNEGVLLRFFFPYHPSIGEIRKGAFHWGVNGDADTKGF